MPVKVAFSQQQEIFLSIQTYEKNLTAQPYKLTKNMTICQCNLVPLMEKGCLKNYFQLFHLNLFYF